MSRATAMASRAREAQEARDNPARARDLERPRSGWKIAAILAGAGVLLWAMSPVPMPDRTGTLPPGSPDEADPPDGADEGARRIGSGSEPDLATEEEA